MLVTRFPVNFEAEHIIFGFRVRGNRYFTSAFSSLIPP